MDTTLALTGALPFIILLAAATSAPLCALLLWLYRRSVLRGMHQRSGQGERSAISARAAAALPALNVVRVAATSHSHDNAAWRHARRALWLAAAAYAVAAVVYAVVMTAAYLMSSGIPFLLSRFAVLGLCFLWPGVLAVMLVAAYARRQRVLLLTAYFAVFTALWLLAPHEAGQGTLVAAAQLWLIFNAAPTTLLLAFLWRRIRAVGPLVLSFMVVALTGSQLLITLASADEALLRHVTGVFFRLGLGGTGTFVALLLLGLLLAAAAGWPLLRWLGRRYEARRLSEMSLTLDALFVLFAVVQSIPLAFSGAAWVASGALAFGAARATLMLLWRHASILPSPPPRLLLLRVFALGARSQRLFDRLRRHWQPLGPMALIAGPDLVTATVEPHEFLDFVSGRLSRQFVSDRADLERRVAAFDGPTAPDGRHRINELFCRADTWQMAMQRLASMSDAVLMDLRSFSADNQGCRFEIARLLDAVDLRHVLLLVDRSTDEPYLQATLQQLWQQLAADSPNRRDGVTLRLMPVDDPDEAALVALLGQLLVQR